MHHTSSKLEHFLGLADLYLQLGRPSVFNIEPQISDEYRPDAYMVKDGSHAVLEYQRTLISQKRMQDKVDRFVNAYAAGKHRCRIMLIASNVKYKVTAPTGFTVRNIEKAPGA